MITVRITRNIFRGEYECVRLQGTMFASDLKKELRITSASLFRRGKPLDDKEEGHHKHGHQYACIDDGDNAAGNGHTKNIGNSAYLTVKEAALLAGINPATVHKWIKKGKIEAVQSSKTVRIPRQAFENWLQSRKKEDQHGINC